MILYIRYISSFLFGATITGLTGYLYTNHQNTTDKSDNDKTNNPTSCDCDNTETLRECLQNAFTKVNDYFYKSISDQYKSKLLSNDCPEAEDDIELHKPLNAVSLLNNFEQSAAKTKLDVFEPEKLETNFLGRTDRRVQVNNAIILEDDEVSDQLNLCLHDYQYHPGRYMIRYKDYSVFIDENARTTNWVVERFCQENVNKCKHHHFETLKMKFDIPQGCDPLNYKANINDLIGMEGRKIYFDIPTRKYICEQCEQSTFWYVFQQYIQYLTKRYPYVYVYSGSLFVPEKNGECDVDKSKHQSPTHYFKMIICRNEFGFYRVECYKIKNEVMCDHDVNLKKYIVPKDELEKDAGVMLNWIIKPFEILPEMTTTHPDFHPDPSIEYKSEVNMREMCRYDIPFEEKF